MSNQNQKRVRTQKAKPVDKAKPVIRKDKRTDVAKVTVTRSITTVMKTAPSGTRPPSRQQQRLGTRLRTPSRRMRSPSRTLARRSRR